MYLKKIIKEEINDFGWAEGPIYFSIDTIIGKQMYYRENNLEELTHGGNRKLTDILRDEIVLGKIKWDRAFKLDSTTGNKANIKINIGGAHVRYNIDEVEMYVNFGIWALEDNGNIINDFSGQYLKESDGLDWIRNVDASSYKPRSGEYIEVINVGDNEDYSNWLGDYSSEYEDGMYGETIKGVVEEVEDVRYDQGFILQEENTDDEIYFPFYEHIKVLNKEDPLNYGRLNIEYRPLFPL